MRKFTNKKKSVITSLVVALGLCTLAGCATTASAQYEIADYFNVPNEVQTTSYVGVEVDLARVKPTDSDATNFGFVLLDAEGKEVETDGYKFVAKTAGTYKCVYSYDLNGEKYEYSYALTATVKDGPVFEDELKLPYALMAGRTYELPTITAKDYSTNASGANANVAISAKCSGASVAVTNNQFTPVYSGVGSEAEITYQATSGGKTETIVKSVPILNPFVEVGVVDFTQIFATSGFESSKVAGTAITYSTINDSEAKFANIMHESGVDFSFGFGANYKAERITVKMESVEDPSVYVTLTYEKGKAESGKGSIILNGRDKKDYTYEAGQQLRVAYNANAKRIDGVGGEALFTVEEDANGNEFEGFENSLVRVSFELDGVYGDADFNVYSIGNFTVDEKVATDMLSPQLYFPSVSTEFLVGETVTISDVMAFDIIDPTVIVELTVKLGNTIITDVNGRAINAVDGKKAVSFVPTRPGDYTLEYRIEDGAGNYNRLKIKRIFYVYDRTAPTISVGGSIATTAKVGDTLTVPTVTATDAESGSAVEVQVVMRWPSGKMRQQGYSKTGSVSGITFKFDKTGTYTLMFVATDESGNYTRLEYNIVCGG